MKNQICITSDIDWAPDEIFNYFLNILAEYKVNATLFMTHKSEVNTGVHELAIHPNYTSFNYEKHISEILSLFPQAKGIRSHSFFFTERLRSEYKKFGFEYESNVMMYRKHNIEPYKMAKSVLEIPLFWMDNFYIEMENNNPSFDFDELETGKPGLKVFNFHPVHVFLNTYSIEHYESAKQYYKDPSNLIKCRNTTRPGVKDLLRDLLEYIKTNNLDILTLQEIKDQHI